MSKWANDLVMDAALDSIADSTVMHACTALSATPTLAEVQAASLAAVAVSGGDFTKADGDTSGRKLTVAAQLAVHINASGDAVNIALVDGSVCRYYTSCADLPLTSGNSVDFPLWDIGFGDPT